VLLYRGPGREVVRGHVGDVAATLLVYALLGLAVARVRAGIRAAITYAIAVAIEVGQTVWQATSFAGELVLGSVFDPWDLVAYAIGVGLAVVWELRALPAKQASATRGQVRPGPRLE
jgi:hypothetical protein